MNDQLLTWTVALRAGPLLDSIFMSVKVVATERREAIRLAKAQARAEGFGRDRQGKPGSVYLASVWQHPAA